MRQLQLPANGVWIGLCLAVFLPLDARAQTPGDILHTDKRLETEERVQQEAQRRINKASGRIQFLLNDLRSNGLDLEGGGKKIATLKTHLDKVANINVPDAGQSLRAARLNLNQSLPHIEKAESKINTVVVELNSVLKGANSLLADDRLVKELQEIIKTEDFLNRQTKEWGKRLILDRSTAIADKGRLGNAQESATSRFDDFLQSLTKEVQQADADSQKRFAAAEKVLRDGNADTLLATAAEKIRSIKVIVAVNSQTKALVLLRKAQNILTSDDTGLVDLLKDLKRIIEEQKKLKAEVEKANQQILNKNKSQFEAKQLGISKDIAAWVKSEIIAETTIKAPLVEALLASGRAKESLEAANKKNAVLAQDEVIAALERAMKIATEELKKAQIEQQALLAAGNGLEGNPTDGNPTDGFPTDGLGDGFGFPQFGFPTPGFPMGGTPGAQGAGTQGAGGGQGQGQGQGKGKGQGQGQGKGKGGQPTPFAGDPKDLEESSSAGTSSTIAKGGKVARTQMARDAVSRRRRSAAIQQYVQQLPPEFRRQVAQYFEALAE